MKKRILGAVLAGAMAMSCALPCLAQAATPETAAAALTGQSPQATAPAQPPETPEAAEIAEAAALETFDASGSCGANARWTLQNGTLTISGSGEISYGGWQRAAVTNLVINEGITVIPVRMFWGYPLRSVTTPASLKEMKFGAFGDCKSLTDVTLKGGILGESAFINCTALRNVTIGAAVTAMGISLFENCPSLAAVYINDMAAWCRIDFGGIHANPVSYAHHLYLNGQEVVDLVVPNGIKSIPAFAFQGAHAIKTAQLPAGLTSIGDYAFHECLNLWKVNIPDGTTFIGGYAFGGCGWLSEAVIPSSVSYVGAYSFSGTRPSSHRYSVNTGVIGPYAFRGCGTLWAVDIGEGVRMIGEGAFAENTGLSVTYGGSRTQWDSLSIAANNGPITDGLKSLTCVGSGTKNPSPAPVGVAAGATVSFGSYEQDGNNGNGKEALEWKVLAVKDGKALLISKYVLDFPRFASSQNVWADSTLRQWLNGSFLNDSFTAAQRASIASTNLTNSDNPVYGTDGGANTTDKVFALSEQECKTYFASALDAAAPCIPSLVAHANSTGGRDTVSGNCYWWVRSPGALLHSAMFVNHMGSVSISGMDVENFLCGVRPAMWVEASALTVQETDIERFVTRLYQVCLNRTPDAGGKADWVGRLASGRVSGVTAAHGFVFSKEFQNKNLCNEDYVKQLYQAFMGRSYDAGGLKDWVEKLESGKTREEVFNGFAMSAEFGNICRSYGILQGDGIAVPKFGTVPTGACSVCGAEDGVTGFVKRMYKVALGREADASGLKDWTNRLWTHVASGTDIGVGFIFSEEFTNKKYSNEDYVEQLYQAFMGRASDAAGKKDWVGQLNAGATREHVFNGFANSSEFNNICNSYGILRG